MNKYEQLIEHIINDETEQARELFHNIIVAKSRDIYESLVDETDLGGNPAADFAQSVKVEEEGLSEEEEEEVDSEVELDNDFDDSGDLDSHEEEHGDVEARVDDLESALDELKAEFDALMAGEAEEPEHADVFGGEEEVGAEEAPEEFYEAEECDSEEDEEEEEVEESIVREYVEKVGETGQKSEGGEVGAGKSASVNAKSTVAGKNDMGGQVALSKGGNANQDGNRPAASEKPKGTLVSNPQNKPGANAGKTAFKTKETAKAGEASVNAKSPVAK